MAGDPTTLTCPHCGGSFEPELLAGDAGRLRGFKCPHCNLFVPEDRAEDADEPALADDA